MKWSFFFVEGGGRLVNKCSIGGQIIAYTNRLTKVTCEEVVKLGAAACISFNLNKAKYASLGTYWPCLNKEEGSFKHQLESVYSGLNAISTLKHGIEMAVHAAGSSGRLVLVGGTSILTCYVWTSISCDIGLLKEVCWRRRRVNGRGARLSAARRQQGWRRQGLIMCLPRT